jgi:RsiW-degrading membrane proteinase PrsW (M82 family)
VEEGLSLRRSIWVSSLITLLGLAIFIGIAAVIPWPAGTMGRSLLGVFLALVPAVIWLVFFYQQDRAEPEPERLVIRMFVFGALAAAAVSVVSQDIDKTIGQYSNLIVRLLLTIFSISLLQEVLKVAMVRYVLLGTNEFDEYPDGIVYGLASGLGFATILTITFVLRSSGVIPLAGAIRAVNNALVHGALGAVSGYYLGRVKFDGKKLSWMAQGLAIVTVVNGLYRVLGDELSNTLVFTPWYGLGAAAVLAIVAVAVLFAFFRRAMLRARGDLSTVSQQIHARSLEMPWDIHVRYDYLLIAGLVVGLVVGLGSGIILHGQSVTYEGEALPVTFVYPTGWAVQTEGAGGLTLRDLTSGGAFKTTISVVSNKTRPDTELDLLLTQQVAAYMQYATMYTEVGRHEDITVDGYPTVQVEYKYATETASGPAVVRGIATYVLVESRLYTLRYEADPLNYENALGRYEQLVQSTRFETGQ